MIPILSNDERLIHRDTLMRSSANLSPGGRAPKIGLVVACGGSVGPVQSVVELIDHPYVVGRVFLVDAVYGPRSLPMHNVVIRLSATPGSIRWGAPAIDQDRDAILAELNQRSVEKQRKAKTGKPTLAS
jgi:crotonobetainyl-CoA:carnitine CoA-transferase CaiB-like acyl-CoA transferase